MIAQPVRQALDFGERPDPALGIVETMRVKDGHLQLREAHYARMDASAKELYGVEHAAPALPTGPLPTRRWDGWSRIVYVPGEGLQPGGLGFDRPDPVYTGIAPFVLAGGLGCHKWADRRLADALTAATHALPVLIDSDGSVLEATWANVLIEEGGRLVSPPTEGRALPGIGRGRLRYGEEPVDLDRLLAADAVVLTSALRTLRLPLGLAG